MRMNLPVRVIIGAMSVAVVAVGGNVLAKDGEAKKGAVVECNDVAFHPQLLEAAQQYTRWLRVGNYPKLAPIMCVAPPVPRPELSSSDDAGTHGRKVYYLFAKNASEYTQIADHPSQPVGQTLVKESWLPVQADGKALAIPSDVKHGLFVMIKAEAKTPGTDQGWIYGTVSPDGKTVTSAGRVQSCMGCHAEAPHDRLFGIKKDVDEPQQ